MKKDLAPSSSRPLRGKPSATRTTLVDQAYLRVKERILANVYPPGIQVLEGDLAEDLGMSRTPVHLALVKLEDEGLVELVPRQGMRVVPLSPADMREIYELLTALETTAVELAARRRPAASELVPLGRAVAEMEAALAAEDLEAWAAADARFHKLLLELSGNRRLAAMAATVSDQAHRSRMVTLRLRPKPTQSNLDHRAVLEALALGDWQRAREVHHAHRLAATRTLTEILERYRLAHL
jgi:DNA-binding GntR family transcriptional regulator